ncbi:hypothetical protein LOK49_LG10G01471 [Camellia lanceoleosa]|uniref:Uncharacterized protein n=1 Tax=Camellia lanceoleosa TaxID=1840588 RepID=A0ACC0G7V2_9ERIC|nr:hypothetical protein LOK49_LG10G01471 [Camellia lanceoleosa]
MVCIGVRIADLDWFCIVRGLLHQSIMHSMLLGEWSASLDCGLHWCQSGGWSASVLAFIYLEYDLKEPLGMVYLENSSRLSLSDSNASTGENSRKTRQLTEESAEHLKTACYFLNFVHQAVLCTVNFVRLCSKDSFKPSKECLAEVFKIDPSSVDNRAKSDLLINLFNSWEANEKQEHKSDLTHEASLADAPSTSLAEIASDANHSEASQTLVLGVERNASQREIQIAFHKAKMMSWGEVFLIEQPLKLEAKY